MAPAMLLAWTSPIDEASDAEFNEWYVSTHVPEIRAAIPEVTSAHRYRLVNPGETASSPVRYLAAYEIDTDDVASSAAKLAAAMAGGHFNMTTTLDVTGNAPDAQWLQAVRTELAAG